MPVRQFLSYVLENAQIVKGLLFMSLVASVPGTILEAVTDWAIINQVYIRIVLGAATVDWAFGTYVHLFKKRDFSITKNITGLGLKLFVLVSMGYIFEGLSHLTAEEDIIYTYLKMVTRILVFTYPARSAMINCSIITAGKFPPAILIKGLTKFNETLDVKDITNQKTRNTLQETQVTDDSNINE